MDFPGEKQATTTESSLKVESSVSKDCFVVKCNKINCLICFFFVLTQTYLCFVNICI